MTQSNEHSDAMREALVMTGGYRDDFPNDICLVTVEDALKVFQAAIAHERKLAEALQRIEAHMDGYCRHESGDETKEWDSVEDVAADALAKHQAARGTK